MKNFLAITSTALCSLVLLSSCASQQETADLKTHLEALDKRVSLLESQKPARPAAAASTISATTTTADTVPQATTSAPFRDISGKFGEKEIAELYKLKVFDPLSGNFEPLKSVTRAEFVRWLMRANNSYFHPIRLAESGDGSFSDVPPTHPDFKYIQGLSDTGWVVGFEDKNFKPDSPLTREEMIGIKTPIDWGQTFPPATVADLKSKFSWVDAGSVSPKFCSAFVHNDGSVASDNIARVYGTTKYFKPKQPVTRAEAAVCLWQFAGPNRNRFNAGP